MNLHRRVRTGPVGQIMIQGEVYKEKKKDGIKRRTFTGRITYKITK